MAPLYSDLAMKGSASKANTPPIRDGHFPGPLAQPRTLAEIKDAFCTPPTNQILHQKNKNKN